MRGSQNAKGPAEAATSPSHGSNNPDEENAVNTATDTTKKDGPLHAENAFDDLEVPISTVLRRAKASMFLMGWVLETKANEHGDRMLCESEIEALASVLIDMKAAAEDLDAIWLQHHNAMYRGAA